MARMLERLHREMRTRRERHERALAIQSAVTPSERHELEVIFQVAEDRNAA